MVTANVPKQMMTRKAGKQAPRKSNSLELQIICPRPQQEVPQVSKVDLQKAGSSHPPQEGDHENARPQPEPAQSLDDTLPFEQAEEERELDPLEL